MTNPTINDVQAVEPILTNMLLGYQQADNRFISMRLAPPVPVQNDSGTYYIYDKKYWFFDDLEVRAPGGDFANLDVGLSTATYKTLQYAGEVSVPDEVRANSLVSLDVFQAKLRKIAQSSMIRKEVNLASTAFAASLWTSQDNNSTTDWDDTTSGDPVLDIKTAVRTVSNLTGYIPNTLACGNIVGQALELHPDILDRIKYVQSATAATISAALSEVLGLTVLVSNAVYSNTNEAATFSATNIIDDDALICYVNPGAGIFDATALKTFVWGPGGGAGTVYRDPARRNHADVAQHKEQWDIKLVSADLGYIFLDVV